MEIERKYQVFISSTFIDLRAEREKAQQALLEADCIPIGMELFPPSDEAQWEYVKKVIDQSDYYVLILGGRYGSIDMPSGLSFTEKEYRFADEIKKPIITFFHSDPGKLPSKFVEQDPSNKKKLEEFRSLALSKLSKPFSDASELYGCVINGINYLKKIRPEGGWIRARHMPPTNVLQEMELLRKENAKLRKRVEDARTGKSSPTAIDSMPNHIAARRAMKAYIAESLRISDSVSVKVMAVSLYYSWDFLKIELPTLLSEMPSHKKVSVELEMVDPEYLGSLGLRDWQEKGDHVLTGVITSIKGEKEISELILSGRVELFLYQYRNIPHWHGMLINNHYLFLGRSRWAIQPDKNICKLSVGEELYRLFASNDIFGGQDRIAMFNSWFDYYKYSGRLVASESVKEA